MSIAVVSPTSPQSWTIQSPYGEPEAPLIPAGDRLIGVYGGKTIYAIDIFTGELEEKGGYPYASAPGLDGPLTIAGGRILFMEDGVLQARRVCDGTAVPGWKAPAIA